MSGNDCDKSIGIISPSKKGGKSNGSYAGVLRGKQKDKLTGRYAKH